MKMAATAPVPEGWRNTGIHSGDVFGPGTREEPIIGRGDQLQQVYVARERDYRSERPAPVCRKGETDEISSWRSGRAGCPQEERRRCGLAC
jgi:hypothetical protein